MTEPPPDENDALLAFRYGDSTTSVASQANNPSDESVTSGSATERAQSSDQNAPGSISGGLTTRGTPVPVHRSQPQTPRMSQSSRPSPHQHHPSQVQQQSQPQSQSQLHQQLPQQLSSQPLPIQQEHKHHIQQIPTQAQQLPQQHLQRQTQHHQLPPPPLPRDQSQLQPIRVPQPSNLYNRQYPSSSSSSQQSQSQSHSQLQQQSQPQSQGQSSGHTEDTSSYSFPSYSIPLSPPPQHRQQQPVQSSSYYGRAAPSVLSPPLQTQSRTFETQYQSQQQLQAQTQPQSSQSQQHYPLPSPPLAMSRLPQTQLLPPGTQMHSASSGGSSGMPSGLPSSLLSGLPSGFAPNLSTALPSALQPPGGPFSYTPTFASTTPVRNPRSDPRSSGGPSRRRRTSSKRSLEEAILESAAPTNININIPTDMGYGGGSSRYSGGYGSSGSRAFRQIGLLRPVEAPDESEFGNPFGVASLRSGDTFTLPLNVAEPPLSSAIPPNPNALQPDQRPRPKKKSKYTQEQDNIILEMKRAGKSWPEIAEAAECTDHLAARNRYQVLIGQQGGGAVVWDAQDIASMKGLLEEGEKVKWEHVASELTRMRSKSITAEQVRAKIRQLFDQSPDFFGIVIDQNIMPFASAGGALPGLPLPTFHHSQQVSAAPPPPPPPLGYTLQTQQQPSHQYQGQSQSQQYQQQLPSQSGSSSLSMPYSTQQHLGIQHESVPFPSDPSSRYGGGYGGSSSSSQDPGSHDLYPPSTGQSGYGGPSEYMPTRR
ncbi:hypothetical protein AWJ20_546 [Sugiyamaella lignohabitans]|uniref:Myb-like domain-containing protein n=1 Tax=Sugiyamaella lignohabitans TaxID=796027 RepID=A0A161HIH4_9ASCO|nr:uncharacterized protein AWJ20_546 [Sugiyamaella lignohabitans]ANB12297.1 hypothetical protein AWJ20_546 [Sugiyamaella lignohabitans]